MSNRFSIDKAIYKVTQGACVVQTKAPKQNRQLTARAVLIATTLAVSACGTSEPALPKGSIGFIGGFLGGVVADEPRAALIGRDVLSSGGTAADAVSAMYFTMAVTLPSRAGLGGGGMCVAFDQKSGKTEVLDFVSDAPTSISPTADRPSAIPGNPRGFFALQARYGKLLWRQVIAPAEQLARFGHPASRAFAQDLADIGPAILGDPGARTVFAAKSGIDVAREGDSLVQLELASTLGLLRARGVGPFYTGPFASNFVEGVQKAGGSLTVEELRRFTPQWRDSVRVEVDNSVAHFAPPPASASTQTAVMLAMINENGRFEDVDEGERAHLMAETGLLAFADRETWMNAQGQGPKDASGLVDANRIETLAQGLGVQTKSDPMKFAPRPQNRHESPNTTTFMAADPGGNAVACAVSMNASFGTGRIVAGSGVLLAAAPGIGGRGPIGLAPMLMVNENSKEFRIAAGANGGVAAPSALVNVLARITRMDQSAKDAVGAPRVHHGGDPDVTYYEPGLSAEALAHLSQSGHRTAATPVLGTVNVLYCPGGLPTKPATCQMVADPRGLGLAAGSMQ
ncbi:gamma-glutamyltransferase [Magnetovibrio blakemorei]|uniref:gamma-glutamyltransferase n=1 Tax=Magnetovibrio blakemorei TaxID=28181 RepID=UPI000B060EF2|nr:gamma-glutamyltransferase [Magnetovibrio blakemorei]